MHMWHHVTNHLIISNDKDLYSENRIKLRVRDKLLQLLKRCFFGVSKAPFNVLLQKGIEWLCYMREAPDKSPVEVAEPKEFAYVFNHLGFLPFFYTCNFNQIHGDCYDYAQKDPWLSGYDYAGREVSLVMDY
jgi:hypothetical protein